jgi:glycosyltransferase involved in cell wall biosynthesis
VAITQATASVAVVHDFLYCYSGAERVLEQILRVVPGADIFALFDFLPPDQRQFLLDKPVRSTFLQRLPLARTKHRAYLPLMPIAIEQLDVSSYDIVISSSYLAAKGILVRPDQLHVCYCHTPVRYAWDLQHQYLRESGLAGGLRSCLARALLHYVRNWDARSSNGVDVFVANSDFIRRRIAKTYRRTARKIYPPVDLEYFRPGVAPREDFYLTASRMVPYKRMDIIVAAFALLPDRRLVVIGDGPDFKRIQKTAGSNVQFLGHQPCDALCGYMQRARAFLFAAEEDFGIVPVEAQACGTPVIAYGRGGVLETVREGHSGLFFEDQSPASIADAVRRFEIGGVAWSPEEIRARVQRFACERFRAEFEKLVRVEWSSFKRHESWAWGSIVPGRAGTGRRGDDGRRGTAARDRAAAAARLAAVPAGAE